jgi:hypothetical protein
MLCYIECGLFSNKHNWMASITIAIRVHFSYKTYEASETQCIKISLIFKIGF